MLRKLLKSYKRNTVSDLKPKGVAKTVYFPAEGEDKVEVFNNTFINIKNQIMKDYDKSRIC